MSEDGGPPSKRIKMGREELDKLSREELLQRYYEQETYIETLVSSKVDGDGDGVCQKDVVGDKLKQQQGEATRRENVLVMRLTTKEQEMQDYLNQIQELKQAQNPTTAQLRGMLLDPAINLMFQRMKKEVESCKEKLEQAQNDLAAWKFTPDSQTGKRLMAKCRMLLQENEELGKIMSSGRTAKLEGEIALEKKFVEEMKISQAETDEFLLEMDEDLEGMQSTIYFLQQQLKEAKEEIVQLQDKNRLLRQAQSMGLDSDATAEPSQAASFLVAQSQLSAEELPREDEEQEMDLGVENAGRDSCLAEVDGKKSRTPSPKMGRTVSPNMTGNVVDTIAACLQHREVKRTSSPPVLQEEKKEEQQQQPQQKQYNSHATDAFHHSQDNRYGDQTALAANGNHNHNAMETDATSEEQAESCDGEVVVAMACGEAQQQQPTQQQTVEPLAASRPQHNNNASRGSNHGDVDHHRPSQSSEGAPYTPLEATDASSDAWSPSNQSKTSGMVSDDDQKRVPDGGPDHEYRTEVKGQANKLGETLHNGLLVSRQYETTEDP